MAIDQDELFAALEEMKNSPRFARLIQSALFKFPGFRKSDWTTRIGSSTFEKKNPTE